MAAEAEFCVLGPLFVRAGGVKVPIAPGKQRVLLAALLLNVNRLVSVEELTQALWGSEPPASARASVHSYVKRLRQALAATGRDRIRTLPGGYLIQVDDRELDVPRFAAAQAAGRRAARHGDWQVAAAELRTALSLWRSAPLADVPSELLAMREVPRLTEMHLQAVEEHIDAEMHLGRHAEVIAELRQLVGAHPLRERLHALLMVALYRDGQQAGALHAYRNLRELLIEELGTEPCPELQQVHQQILAADPALAGPLPAILAAAGSSGTAAQRRGANVPHQLPLPVRDFTGRAAELAVLNDLASTSTVSGQAVLISAIAGTAGVGKTALAVRWSHQASGRFPDGQLYVNLRGYDPGRPMPAADALAGFLSALGITGPDMPAGLEERAALYRSLLAGRRILVLLDNAGEPDQVRPLLPATPGTMAIVTSRNALAGLVACDGAIRLDIDLLPQADAVSMLRALIGRRVDCEPAAAAALASHCCRLPLALRVAAEHVAARPATSLASLAAELDDLQQRLDLLTAGGDVRASVRAVFSWSYRHLDAEAARAFQLAGLQPGPDFDRFAFAALTDSTPAQAGRMLGQLAQANLIQPAGPHRYVMHDLLRAYALELAESHDNGGEREAAVTRLLDYYLQAAATAMDALYPAERGQRPEPLAATASVTWLTDPEAARTWLAAELPCLVAGVAHAAAHGWYEHAIRLAATIFRYLDPSGHLCEAVTVHESAWGAARHRGDAAAEARAASNLAAAELRQGRDQEAADHLQQALSLSRRTGDRTTEARALGNLGVLAFWQGRYWQAADYYERSLRLLRKAGNRAGEVTGLCNLAGAQMRLRQYEQAASYLQQALVLSRDIGNRDGEAYALLNLGDISLRQGRDELADPYLRQSLALSRQLGDRAGEAAALSGLGELDLRQGRYQHAARQLHTALTLSREAGARTSQADALHLLGEVSLATGDHRQARIHHASALDLASQARDIHLQARAHDGLARAYQAEGDAQQAQHHRQQAITRYTQLGAPEADEVRSQLTTLSAPTPARDRA